MKKIIGCVLAGLMLAGCQPKEASHEQQASGTPTVEQRKEVARKLTEQAMLLISKQDFKGALTALDTAIKFDPTDQDPYMILGQILLKAGEYARAVEFLDNASKAFPQNGMIFYMLSVANKMENKKLPAVLAARRSYELFKSSKDEENAKNAAALLQQEIELPDAPAAK